MTDKTKPTGLDLLREPFPAHQISKLPKPTRKQTDEVKADFKKGIRCKICGGWHHPDVVHLDYVGHAALTDRLLDCDSAWNWEPLATHEHGGPMIDGNGGMWIKLTICGVSRIGYGHPDGKQGGDAVKELIGDALRNAAMRFGAALDLWHKGDLHIDDEPSPTPEKKAKPNVDVDQCIAYINDADDLGHLKGAWDNLPTEAKTVPAVMAAKDKRKAELTQPADDLAGDEIPYEGK